MVPHEAASGVDALAWLEHHQADIAALDMQMPEMDGLELSGRIRATAHGAQLPLVLFSSAAGLRERNDPRWENFASCFTKPVKQAQRLNALLLGLGRHTPTTDSSRRTPCARLARAFRSAFCWSKTT